MGSFQSHPSTTSSSTDSLNNSSNISSSKLRKSKRLIDKLRSRQPSKSDLIGQTMNVNAIDPIKSRAAQNPDGGEKQNRDQNYTTADVDQITIKLSDDEESQPVENNNKVDVATPSNQKPVFNEDRHILSDTTTSHTDKHVETESTKHNADKAVSCSSTATNERSRSEDFQQKSRESSDNKISFDDQSAFDGEECRVLIETESWRTAKNWKSSTAARTDQGISATGGNVIVIREAPTSSSSESIFTDPENSDVDQTINLTITKLEQLSLVNDQPNLQIVHHEQVNYNGGSTSTADEMPIVKKNGEIGQQENGGTDKGIFSVSRVKKVELPEIPHATDICAVPTPPEQQTVTTPTLTGNNIVKSSNGSGKVLHRVITLTTASHSDNNLTGKTASKPSPAYVPEKLHFSAYEKFEGQMLVNWFAQSLQSIASSMTKSLNENDLNALSMQYCANLLVAGVIRQLDASSLNVDSFKPNSMYQWTHKGPAPATPITPGKLETSVVWPHASEKKTSPKTREGESKIPKLLASTPKARIQLVSSLVTMNEQTPPLTLLNGIETDHNKVNELKTKMVKCVTIQEMFALIKTFLSEYSMQSSESSSNSGIFNGSMLNGSDSTVFDRSMETTVFSVLQQRQHETPTTKVMTTPKSKTTVKSRTSPSTPTGASSGRSDLKRFRRNLSDNAVNLAASVTPTSKSAEINNGSGCKRCSQRLTSPIKIVEKRMVDKATVMEVELIEFPKASELVSIETQTDLDIKDDNEVKKEEISTPIPPPPPPMMNIPAPPAPPPLPGPNIPGPPPPPPPGGFNGNSIPAPPNLPPMGFGPPMPFPPPLTPSSGPGKLQSQPSTNVSSLVAAPGKPKPLPLIPASEFYLANTLRKNAVNPPKPMKPLYWTRIVAPIKSVDMLDGPLSASSTPEEKKESEEDEELWKEIDETKLDNLDEFTELFSRQGVVPKAKTTAPIPKIKAIKVLDSKRSQNVGIFVRSIHIDFAEIEHAIYHCDTSVVSLETLQHIMEIKASKEELMMIQEAASNHTEGSPPLDSPENFLLKISQVSSSAERISCIVFQAEFDEQCTMVSRKLMTVKSLCEFLLENEGLKEVFSIILTLGNFMNGGNRQRGQADGFGLEILGKLKDVKSKDPKITLLHFIVKTSIERSRKSGCAISDLVLPIPDPNDVDKSLSIDFEECKQQLNALKLKIEELKKTTEKVIAASAEDCVQPFKEKMEQFIEMAIKKIDNRYQKLDECQVLFIKTIKFYKFTPKKGTYEDTAPAQFFEYWKSFTSDYNDIFKKELLILTNELLKKTRQVTKPQSKPTSGENNLKARINRLKNRNN